MFILLVLFGFVYEYLLLIEQKQLEIKQSERAYYRDCEETIEKDWWSRLSSWYSKSSESDCNRVELQISVNTFLHVNPVLVPFSLLRRMLSSLLLGLGHTSGIEIASFLKQFTLTQSIWITLLFAIFIFVFLNSFPAILVNFVYAFYSLYANRNSHILFRSAYFEQTQHSLQPIANDNATRRLAVRRRPVHHPIRMNRYPSYRIKNTNHLRIKALQSPSSNSHS